MADKISTRVAYGKALCEFGSNKRVVVFDADLTTCTMSMYFAQKYPQRFRNCGIAEANMTDMAAGAATVGKIAFCNTFAVFAAGRCYDQIRNSIAYPHLNVKVVGTHAGLSVGEDGATHQMIEDLALMRAIPGMTVICPADANETRAAVKAIIEYEGPCYLRLGRAAVDPVTDFVPDYKFEIGKGVTLRQGTDVTIIAIGQMVQIAMKAAELLAARSIQARVIDMHTVKPLDRELVLKAARETGAIVTSEEHNIIGGLGAAVCELCSAECLVPVLRHGVEDKFGHSGPANEIMDLYGLNAEKLAELAVKAVSLKK